MGPPFWELPINAARVCLEGSRHDTGTVHARSSQGMQNTMFGAVWRVRVFLVVWGCRNVCEMYGDVEGI